MATKKTKIEKTLESKSYKEATNKIDTIEGVKIGTTIGKSVAKIDDKKVETPFDKLNVYLVSDIPESMDDESAHAILDTFWNLQDSMAEALAKDSTPDVYDTQAKKNTKRDFGEFRAASKTEFLARALTTYSGIQNNAGNWPLHDDAKKPAGTKREASVEALLKEVGAILMPFNSTEKQSDLFAELFTNERFENAIEKAMNPESDDANALAFATILVNARNNIG